MKKLTKIAIVGIILVVLGVFHEQILSIPTKKYEYNWTSVTGGQKTIDKGKLVKYAVDYYAAHDTTQYGKEMLAMKEGDKLTIDGKKVEIEGSVIGFKGETIEEIEDKAPRANVYFQTCCRLFPYVYHIKYGEYK